jgi:UrcA family protein
MRFLYAVTGAALAACVCFAQAQTSDTSQNAVRYSDLDLTTDSGAGVMLDRMTQAALKVCKENTGTPAQRRCVAEALAGSVKSLNAPAVTRLYLARRH